MLPYTFSLAVFYHNIDTKILIIIIKIFVPMLWSSCGTWFSQKRYSKRVREFGHKFQQSFHALIGSVT